MKITAVTCVKNEGPFLLEWVAYNRLIGVTDFLFYSNDCDDGTVELLDALMRAGIVVHQPNPAEGRHYQMEALKHAPTQAIVRNAEWLWVADVDEFLNIHVGQGTIPELVAACGNPHAISVSYQFFANGGVDRFEDKPVIEQFTQTHDPNVWNAETAIEVKTLTRNDFPVKYYGAHRPFLKPDLAKSEQPGWTDGSGRPVMWKFRVGSNTRRLRKFPARGARDFASVNHYPLRALDSYLVKHERGDVNREHREFGLSYWQDRNDGAWEETSILRHLPALKREIASLLAEPGVAAAHKDAVRRHRAKCDALMKRSDYKTLRDELKSAPALPRAELALCDLLEIAS